MKELEAKLFDKRMDYLEEKVSRLLVLERTVKELEAKLDHHLLKETERLAATEENKKCAFLKVIKDERGFVTINQNNDTTITFSCPRDKEAEMRANAKIVSPKSFAMFMRLCYTIAREHGFKHIWEEQTMQKEGSAHAVEKTKKEADE